MGGTILVTGATGRVGGATVRALVDAGARVRALSRAPVRLPVEVAVGDLAAPSSLEEALDGVDAALLVFPTLQADHAAAELVARLADRVPRIVYLSAAGADVDADGILGSHGRLEALIRESVADWTFLRSGGFAANTLMWADQIRAGDEVRGFHGAAARSLVHEADIAAVATRALLDGHPGATHHITGPATLTQVEQVAAIGAALDRPLRFVELPPAQAARELFAGFPPEMARGVIDAHEQMIAHPEPVTTTVLDVTGHPARPYHRWASDHAADFR